MDKTMIEKINYITNIGSYYNFNPTDLKLFNKFNLIYGDNGSGKSTLSSIFRTLSQSQEINTLPKNWSQENNLMQNCELVVNGNLINKDKWKVPIFIEVFNREYVRENISKKITKIASQTDKDSKNEDIVEIGKLKIELSRLETDLSQLNLELDTCHKELINRITDYQKEHLVLGKSSNSFRNITYGLATLF